VINTKVHKRSQPVLRQVSPLILYTHYLHDASCFLCRHDPYLHNPQSLISRIKAGLSSGSSSQTDAASAAHNDDIEAELFGFKPQSITLTKCECHVGSVRIEVSSSKHDALYNMMASHLEQILKAEIANTIATTIKDEFNAVLSKLNDRVAEQWHNLQMKTCQRLICTVVRAKVRRFAVVSIHTN
jgi:hypothetical protein